MSQLSSHGVSCRITITVALLERVRRELRESPGRVIEIAAGVHRDRDMIDVLAPCAATTTAPVAILRFASLPRSLEGISHHWWEGFDVPQGPRPRVDVFLHEQRGCSAALLCDGAVHPIREILISGPRMDRWIPTRTPPDLIGTVPDDGPFSRYIGALGGDGPHGRMRSQSIAFIGSARLASLSAVGFARAGARRITLIDGDILESHSRDAVEVLARDACGRPKPECVGRMIEAVTPEVEVETLACGVEDPAAARACARADLIVSAPDQNQARLFAAMYSTAYLLPHLDLGSGVFGEGARFVAGADVRLIVPGDGCLLCVGSLDLTRRHERDWRRQRAGSLRSLNGLAVSYAQFLVERFICGDVIQSTWVQLVLDRHAELSTRKMPRERDPDCPLCALSGRGDDAAFDLSPATDPVPSAPSPE